MDSIKTLLEEIEGKIFECTLSKPRVKTNDLRNIYFRPILLKDKPYYQATFRYKTRDETKNYTPEQITSILARHIQSSFYHANFTFQDQKISILQSKKGRVKILKKAYKSEINPSGHDHSKRRFVPQSAPFLHDLGITSATGHILQKSGNKYKQINKFVEIIDSLVSHSSINNIIDMGCGKGYLTFGLYHYLHFQKRSNVKIKGVEIRKDLVEKNNAIAQKNQYTGLSFEVGDIGNYHIENTDVIIALHACDIATDMAIAKGIEASAKYIIVAPCCHKQIRKEMQIDDKNPVASILKHGILLERQAEMVTDAIRALILQSRGYKVKVFQFVSTEHTAKNIMITAQKKGFPSSTPLVEIQKLKSFFGIKKHYLEELVEDIE